MKTVPFKAFFHGHIFVSYVWILATRDWIRKFKASEIQTVLAKVNEATAGVSKPKDKITLQSLTFDRRVKSQRAKSGNKLAL